MNYRPDPGGNFASDEHRRVLAAVNNDDIERVPFEVVADRVIRDDQLNLSQADILEILKDLEADGDVNRTDEGYDSTEMGQEALQGPPSDAGGRKYGEVEASAIELTGETENE